MCGDRPADTRTRGEERTASSTSGPSGRSPAAQDPTATCQRLLQALDWRNRGHASPQTSGKSTSSPSPRRSTGPRRPAMARRDHRRRRHRPGRPQDGRHLGNDGGEALDCPPSPSSSSSSSRSTAENAADSARYQHARPRPARPRPSTGTRAFHDAHSGSLSALLAPFGPVLGALRVHCLLRAAGDRDRRGLVDLGAVLGDEFSRHRKGPRGSVFLTLRVIVFLRPWTLTVTFFLTVAVVVAAAEVPKGGQGAVGNLWERQFEACDGLVGDGLEGA